MHIHANPLNVQAAEFSAISNGEVAARRAAEVRKRLLKSAQRIAVGAGPEESPSSSEWLDAFHSQVQTEDEYRGDQGEEPHWG